MAYFDYVTFVSFTGLFVGILLLIIGLYARHDGKLRNRHGAAVLAGSAVVTGALAVGVGLLALLSGA